MKRKDMNYRVSVGIRSVYVTAKTPGAAARRAFKHLIAEEYIANQPASDDEGGWKGVAIDCQGRPA